MSGEQPMLSRPMGRCAGPDVHLDFIEIAICVEGKGYSAGRGARHARRIGTLAECLLPTDRVALEATGSSRDIVRLLGTHVSKVIVLSPRGHGKSASAGEDRPDRRAR